MAITKEILDELLKDYHGPDDFYGPNGIIKQLSKALIERAMEAELTGQIGYEKNEPGEKAAAGKDRVQEVVGGGGDVSASGAWGVLIPRWRVSCCSEAAKICRLCQ